MTTVFVTPNHDTSMVSSPTEDISYNGWANFETWNVALWIGNDEVLYQMARECCHLSEPYEALYLQLMDCDIMATPDGVAWDDANIDFDELNEMIAEM